MVSYLVLLCWFLWLVEVGSASNSSLIELHILGLIPVFGKTRDVYGHAHAIQMAIDMINERSDILPGYKVILDYGDTRGASKYAIAEFARLIYEKPTKIMILGPGNTRATKPIADSSTLWHLLVLSFGATSPILGDLTHYPYTFRNLPSAFSYNKARVALIKHFGWNRVAIIHQFDDEFYSPSASDLKQQLKNNNINITTVEGFSLDSLEMPTYQMENIKAYKLGMYGEKYVWIVLGGLMRGWQANTRNYPPHFECNADKLYNASDGYFSTVRVDIRSDNITTVSGLTPTGYINKLKEKIKYPYNFTSFAFDAMWTIALTLNKTIETETPPEKFSYKGGRKFVSLYKTLMQNISFEGISGPVRYNDERERIGTVLIKRFKNGIDSSHGYHYTYNNKLIFHKEPFENGIPSDITKRKEVVLMYDLTVIIVTWSLSGMGLVYSMVFLQFNIKYRHCRLIKMSSPMLNNLIILGGMLTYFFVIVDGMDTRFISPETLAIICNIRAYTLAVGLSLAFGAMFSKTWRVHKIFTAAKVLKKMAIRDRHLLGVVAIIVLVDVIYFLFWGLFDPFTVKKIRFDEVEIPEEDLIVIPVLYQCTCRYINYLKPTLYSYKGCLLPVGAFLAWETRHVSIPALNDSKYIGMSVYNVVTLSIIGVIISTVLQGTVHYETTYVISSLVVIICTTVTESLVFLPKMYHFGHKKNDFRQKSVTMTTTQTGMNPVNQLTQRLSVMYGRGQNYAPTKSQSTQTPLTRGKSKSLEFVDLTFDLLQFDGCKLNLAFNEEIEKGDEEMDLDNTIELPKTQYGTERVGKRLVPYIETDM